MGSGHAFGQTLEALKPRPFPAGSLQVVSGSCLHFELCGVLLKTICFAEGIVERITPRSQTAIGFTSGCKSATAAQVAQTPVALQANPSLASKPVVSPPDVDVVA